MEVDLVICFDANISPLRMIQRMGRTGRKHDGRVDILFLCISSLLKLLQWQPISFGTCLGSLTLVFFPLSRLIGFLDKLVLVLACEGSELKGYMRKQANSKAVNKHMRNGGINSFDFHSSPRMVTRSLPCSFFLLISCYRSLILFFFI